MRYAWVILMGIIFPMAAQAAVVVEPVDYKDGDTELQGLMVYDNTVQEKRPGVLVIHEWKGLNNYARDRAMQLAEDGYIAFAVDMYGKGVFAGDDAEAAKLSGIYRNDRNLMRRRAKAAYDVLKAHPLTDPLRMAAIGYSFGGTTVLEMARAGFDLQGVVSFYGGLDTPTPAQKGVILAKVLVLHGAEDPMIKPEQMAAFQEEMKVAEADWQLVIFGDAVHGFTVRENGRNKSKGMAYNRKADKRSWKIMKLFFREIF